MTAGKAYAGQRGILLDQVVPEIASGLNDRRPKLRNLLGDRCKNG